VAYYLRKEFLRNLVQQIQKDLEIQLSVGNPRGSDVGRHGPHKEQHTGRMFLG
jgi:hypothetical protein